jgi:hypothetical protein
LIDDSDVWSFIDPEDLWIYDKLILSRRLGYICGPAGVAPKETANYIVRPLSNYRMMGRGSSIQRIEAGEDIIPDGYFWCEVFTGAHTSYDYNKGEQCLAVEGVRDANRTDRFSLWRKIDRQFQLPEILQRIADKYEHMNIEVIGERIIEVHLRYNDDFAGHNASEIIPIWRESFYDSPCGDRVGFLLR